MKFQRTNAAARLLLLLFILPLLQACGGVHSEIVKSDRLSYNMALQRSNDEQLLANIVRLRYAESPSFMEINSITSQYALDAGLSLGYEYTEQEDGEPVNIGNKYMAGLSAGFSSRPTVTYAPLTGEAFLNRLLRPLSIDQLILLLNSGWDLKRVFTLCVQSINDLPNAPRASAPAVIAPPEYESFAEAVSLIQRLAQQGLVEIILESKEEGALEAALKFSPRSWDLPETQRLAQLLELEPGGKHYPLRYRVIPHMERGYKHTAILLETRSVQGLLFFLSHAVEVPARDVDSGVVSLTKDENGEIFDWSNVLGDVFNIHSGAAGSVRIYSGLRYRDTIFYIDDRDVSSKATLTFLSQVFAMQAGGPEAISPVLTLPVGR